MTIKMLYNHLIRLIWNPLILKLIDLKKALIWNPLIFKFLIWAFLYNEGFEIPLFEYLKLDLDLDLNT